MNVRTIFQIALFVVGMNAFAQSRSVRLSFLPPPLEGTVSLGIYNASGQLVRVLQQEANFDEFNIGADALNTKWDGKDDDGVEVPPGKYSARGFLIAPPKIDEIADVPSPTPAATPQISPEASPTVSVSPTPTATPLPESIAVRLIANPLNNNDRPVVKLAVGFDDENAFVKTADGLPVITIAPATDIKRGWIVARPDKSLDVFLDNGTAVRQFHLSGAAKMMAFDAGEFQLK